MHSVIVQCNACTFYSLFVWLMIFLNIKPKIYLREIISYISKCICITLYNYTVHCTIRTRVQSLRRQQRKRTVEKSEMVTYKDTTQLVINNWVLIKINETHIFLSIWVVSLWVTISLFFEVLFLCCLLSNWVLVLMVQSKV